MVFYAVDGLGAGSFFFLLVSAVVPGWIPINPLSIATLFMMSMLIGELTFLLNNGKLVGYIAHCVLTFTFTIAWLLANGLGFKEIPGGLVSVVAAFVIIYALVWIIVITFKRMNINKINKKLNENR
ncbi:DUF3021 family protein [Bifidobacterium sp. ESL0784]|uniref:DUF3021 family protein n=1 Tax=Bifidobacterium sp. ESL0784 TaxID=2983231 RepID=UPI0023F6BFFB|nr:DUF3021 family protein [Bifidobacterium sp. ESL0784]